MKTVLTLFLAFTMSSTWAQTKSIKGAWRATQANNSTATMIVADNYLMIASYNVMNRYFDRTQGDLPTQWIAMAKRSFKSLTAMYSSNRMLNDYIRQYYLRAARRRNMLAENDWAECRRLAAWE